MLLDKSRRYATLATHCHDAPQLHRGLDNQLARSCLGLLDIVYRFMWPAIAIVSEYDDPQYLAATRIVLTGMELQEPPRFTAQVPTRMLFMHIALR